MVKNQEDFRTELNNNIPPKWLIYQAFSEPRTLGCGYMFAHAYRERVLLGSEWGEDSKLLIFNSLLSNKITKVCGSSLQTFIPE